MFSAYAVQYRTYRQKYYFDNTVCKGTMNDMWVYKSSVVKVKCFQTVQNGAAS